MTVLFLMRTWFSDSSNLVVLNLNMYIYIYNYKYIYIHICIYNIIRIYIYIGTCILCQLVKLSTLSSRLPGLHPWCPAKLLNARSGKRQEYHLESMISCCEFGWNLIQLGKSMVENSSPYFSTFYIHIFFNSFPSFFSFVSTCFQSHPRVSWPSLGRHPIPAFRCIASVSDASAGASCSSWRLRLR